MNIKLKIALFERVITQKKLSEEAKIPRNYISQAIRGRINLTADEKKRIADVLKMQVSELF